LAVIVDIFFGAPVTISDMLRFEDGGRLICSVLIGLVTLMRYAGLNAGNQQAGGDDMSQLV